MAALWLLEYYTPNQSLAYPGLVFDHVPQRLAPHLLLVSAQVSPLEEAFSDHSFLSLFPTYFSP